MKTVKVRQWSPMQQAVFEDAARGAGHTMVEAVAGSGKTTTLLEMLTHFTAGLSVLFVAFNKAIIRELKERCTLPGVEITTLHALGFKAVARALNLRGDVVEAHKMDAIVDRVTGADKHYERREWANSVAKAVSLVKSYLARTDEQIADVIDAHGLCPPEREEDRVPFIRDVRACINEGIDSLYDAQGRVRPDAKIDFDDMIFLPAALDLPIPQYDRVCVDETQDLNAAQIALILKAVKSGGRITAVGDPRQAIYTFRGAGSDAFGDVQRALDAKILPLSVSYRCSRAVIREAQKWVPHIEAAPDAVDGSVTTVAESMLKRDAQPGDFVLSRANAPLLPLCLHFLKQGIPAAIQGRDVGTKLSSVAKRAKTDDVDAMLKYVDRWVGLEVQRLARRKRDSSGVEDIGECLHALSEGETSVKAVLAKVERLFADGDSSARVTLSSTHKAKGMERDRVWLLRETYMKRQGQEEENLIYVAITRAQRDLFIVLKGQS